MLTVDLLANTALSVPSALIIRLFFASCSLFFLMYAHSRFVTSVRGIGLEPTTSASAALGVTGFMNAAFGLRAAFLAFFAIGVGVLSRREVDRVEQWRDAEIGRASCREGA